MEQNSILNFALDSLNEEYGMSNIHVTSLHLYEEGSTSNKKCYLGQALYTDEDGFSHTTDFVVYIDKKGKMIFNFS